VHLLVSLHYRNWQFLTYIKPKESRSISYNPAYLFLACVENFAVTVTLINILNYFFRSEIDDYRLMFIVSIALLRKFLTHAKIKWNSSSYVP